MSIKTKHHSIAFLHYNLIFLIVLNMKYLAFKKYFYKIIVKIIMFVTWFQINYRKISFNCPWNMYINTASKGLIELELSTD